MAGVGCRVMLLSMLVAGCNTMNPLAPPSAAATSQAPPSPTGPATVYDFSGPLTYPVSDFTKQSRITMYENGAFTLHYLLSNAVIAGTYSGDSSNIIFRFTAGSGFTGTLKGTSLEVRFDARLEMADFESAVYKRSQTN